MGDWQEDSTEHTRLMADSVATEPHSTEDRSTVGLEAGRPSGYGSDGQNEGQNQRNRRMVNNNFILVPQSQSQTSVSS